MHKGEKKKKKKLPAREAEIERGAQGHLYLTEAPQYEGNHRRGLQARGAPQISTLRSISAPFSKSNRIVSLWVRRAANPVQ